MPDPKDAPRLPTAQEIAEAMAQRMRVETALERARERLTRLVMSQAPAESPAPSPHRHQELAELARRVNAGEAQKSIGAAMGWSPRTTARRVEEARKAHLISDPPSRGPKKLKP